MRDLEKWNPDVRPRLEKALMQYLIPQDVEKYEDLHGRI